MKGAGREAADIAALCDTVSVSLYKGVGGFRQRAAARAHIGQPALEIVPEEAAEMLATVVAA